MSDTNWNDVGDKIKDAVDSAISTGDFSNLSRSIGDVINDTIDNVKGSVKTAAQQNKKHTVQTHITKQYTQNRHRISHSLRHCTTNVPAVRQVLSSVWHWAIPWVFLHWPV
ncbi:MAG: hypothetical protein ACLUD0_09130 [Eubacterium ramulus]